MWTLAMGISIDHCTNKVQDGFKQTPTHNHVWACLPFMIKGKYRKRTTFDVRLFLLLGITKNVIRTPTPYVKILTCPLLGYYVTTSTIRCQISEISILEKVVVPQFTCRITSRTAEVHNTFIKMVG
jgi:hypothetical protein